MRVADLSELRPTRLRRYPATNITPPITIEPSVTEVMVGSCTRQPLYLEKNAMTAITAPNDKKIPPTPISAAANPERM
jgi:hypothetical protein